MQKQKQELHRGLEERHISLMSLGAAIGVGLFLGSASAIQLAGVRYFGSVCRKRPYYVLL
nr:hypothetical protein P5642_00430 [Bacillus subtilis]